MLTFYYFVAIMNQGSYKPPWYEVMNHSFILVDKRNPDTIYIGKLKYNKNLYGRDGRTICGPQCMPISTSVTLAVDEKTLPMATITGRTDRQTDRQSATQYAAPS